MSSYKNQSEEFNQVLQINGKDATAFGYRGLAHCRFGNNHRAIKDLHQAVKLFSEQGRREDTIAF